MRSHSTTLGSGRAPTNSSITSPSTNSFTLGMLRTPYWAEMCGKASVSSLTRAHSSECSPASFSSTGPRTLHGPHHSAQKSTSTGIVRLRSMTSLSKSLVSYVTISST